MKLFCDSKSSEDRGRDIPWPPCLFGRPGAAVIRGTKDRSATNSGTRKGNGIHRAPVFATGQRTGKTWLQCHQRSSAEFSHTDYQCCLQQAPLIEVLDQRRKALVESWQQMPSQAVEYVVVSVPAPQIRVVRFTILTTVAG